jgi:hypothetical protein
VDDAHTVAHRRGDGSRRGTATGASDRRFRGGRPAPVLDRVTTTAMRLILSGES